MNERTAARHFFGTGYADVKGRHMIGKIWQLSGDIISTALPSLPRRIMFTISAFRHRNLIQNLSDLEGFPGLAIAENPAFLAMVQAPYIHANWDAEYRVGKLIDHLTLLSKIGPEILGDDGLTVAVINLVDDKYFIVIDRPIWFHREGTLAINIFKENIRLFTIAFSFNQSDSELTCIVGGIQGRNLPNVLDDYRKFTKSAHGLRPRDMLFAALRYFAEAKGATRLLCIADNSRHHRSRFFGRDISRHLPMDYDEVWLDRGGERIEGGFFDVPMANPLRHIDEVPAKKRAMYRKRYEMLDSIQRQIAAAASYGIIEKRIKAD